MDFPTARGVEQTRSCPWREALPFGPLSYGIISSHDLFPKDVLMRAYCCAVGQRQCHAGGVIGAGAARRLPRRSQAG